MGKQAATGWQAGFARAKITPEKPMPLGGYANRTAPFESVTLDLHMKAMALEDVQGHRALLITADLLGFPGPLAGKIRQRIGVEAGVESASILLNGSHTHHGPSVDDRGPDPLSAEGRALGTEYARALEDKAAAIAKQAVDSLRPARLSWGAGMVDFPMNRRVPTPRGITLGDNPRGYADRTVPVLRVDTPDGKIIGLVFGAACHGVTLNPQLTINGDYAGYAQAHLEEKYPGVQAMFIIGCAGDVDLTRADRWTSPASTGVRWPRKSRAWRPVSWDF